MALLAKFWHALRHGKAMEAGINEIGLLGITPLSSHWPILDPILFCAYHNDAYPDGDDDMARPRPSPGTPSARTLAAGMVGACITATGCRAFPNIPIAASKRQPWPAMALSIMPVPWALAPSLARGIRNG